MEYWDAQALEQRRAASLEQRQPIAVWHTAWGAWVSVLGDPIGFIARTWPHVLLIALAIAWGDHETRRWHEIHRVSLFFVLAYLALIPVAVQWHRHVLLEEDRRGLAALRFKGRELAFLVSIIGMNIVIEIVSLIGDAVAWIAGSLGSVPRALGALAAAALGMWATARLILVPPLRALDQPNSFDLSYSFTKGRALPIIGVGLLAALPVIPFVMLVAKAYELKYQPMEIILLRAAAAAALMVCATCVLAAAASLLMKALGSGFLLRAASVSSKTYPVDDAIRH